jgi:hypothetical protein
LSAPAALTGLQLMTPGPFRGEVNAIYLCIVTLVAIGGGPPLIGALNDYVLGGGGLKWSILTVALVGSTGGAIAAWRSVMTGPAWRRSPSPIAP